MGKGGVGVIKPINLHEPDVDAAWRERRSARACCDRLPWDRLTTRQRWVVELVIMNGYTTHEAALEIARITGGGPLSIWTIQRELNKARRLLGDP